MNCRRIEEMIPLYVGGDLERNRAERVSAHLRSCPTCSDIAGKYNESQEWLQSYRPPELGSAFFDDLKRGVLSQIEREESRPSFFQAVTARWKWNAVFATAALLVIVGGLVFYAYYRGGIERPAEDKVVLVPQKDEPKMPPHKEVAPSPGPDQQISKQPRRHRRETSRETVAQVVEPLPLEERIEPPTVSQREESEPSPLEENPHTEEIPVTREATIRIEIQTSDPNIRIIWFVPKDPNKLLNRRATDT